MTRKGKTEEGLSELLKEHWDNLGELIKLARNNPSSLLAYERVQRRIGEIIVEMERNLDHRESKEMWELMESLGWEMVQLKNGDYTTKSICVERKSDDFFQSVFDRRIFRQLSSAAEDCDLVFLVIDKSMAEIRKEIAIRKLPKTLIHSIFASLAVRGFPPILMDSKWDSALFIDALAKKAYDEKDRIPRPFLEAKKPKNKDWAQHVLESFPGIGEKRARELLEEHGNLWDVLCYIRTYSGKKKTILKIKEILDDQFSVELSEVWSEETST